MIEGKQTCNDTIEFKRQIIKSDFKLKFFLHANKLICQITEALVVLLCFLF